MTFGYKKNERKTDFGLYSKVLMPLKPSSVSMVSKPLSLQLHVYKKYPKELVVVYTKLKYGTVMFLSFQTDRSKQTV